jgi:hypothetical protein
MTFILQRNWSHPLKNSTIVLSICLLLSASGCNQPFDPRAPIEPQLVVFSVLSNDRTTQFVRVQSNYMPSGFDPATSLSDNSVTDAVVTLKDSLISYRFRDTVIERQDTTRYNFPMHIYGLPSFIPQRGRPYTLTIESPTMGTATASVTIPARSNIYVQGYSVESILRYPEVYTPDVAIPMSAQLSGYTQAYIGRLYLYYDVLKGTEWIEERVEVPLGSADSVGFNLIFPRYPDLTLLSGDQHVNMVFFNGYYLATIKERTFGRYEKLKIIYKWAVFVLLQTDLNLYNYYSTVHEFRDPRSIRLDEPMYSNVKGGTGMVGAYTLDSVVVVLPASFMGNR